MYFTEGKKKSTRDNFFAAVSSFNNVADSIRRCAAATTGNTGGSRVQPPPTRSVSVARPSICEILQLIRRGRTIYAHNKYKADKKKFDSAFRLTPICLRQLKKVPTFAKAADPSLCASSFPLFSNYYWFPNRIICIVVLGDEAYIPVAG